MSQSMDSMIVNAGCLLFFHDCLDNQDVLDTTLYAQLAASKKHSRFAEYAEWKKTWLTAALNVGWISQASKNLAQPAPCKEPATFWSLAKALRPSFVSEVFLDRCEAKVKQLSPHHTAFTLFTDQVIGAEASTLAMQLGVVDENYGLTLLQLHFETVSPLSRDRVFGPWEHTTIKGNIEFSFHHLQLSQTIYSPRRNAVITALKERRAGLIYKVLCSEATE